MPKNTIKLKKYLDVIEEYQAVAALYPGHLLELTSAGKVQKHSTAGGPVLPMFALEDELQGKSIDDAYGTNDPVQVWVAVRGEVVYAVLADGQDIDTGDFLISAGNGMLTKFTSDSAGVEEYPQSIVAQALEDLDLSGSSGEETPGALGYHKRIKVRIM